MKLDVCVYGQSGNFPHCLVSLSTATSSVLCERTEHLIHSIPHGFHCKKERFSDYSCITLYKRKPEVSTKAELSTKDFSDEKILMFSQYRDQQRYINVLPDMGSIKWSLGQFAIALMFFLPKHSAGCRSPQPTHNYK